MARHVSVATAIEKNRIASQYAFVPLLEVDVIDISTNSVQETLYIARNSEDVTYMDNVYAAASFDFEIKESSQGIPEISVSTVDFTKTIQKKVDTYDGGVGFIVRLLVVNSGKLDEPAPINEEFYVLSTEVQDYVVSWRLGARNPLRQRFPRRLQFKDRCPWKFKGNECGYTGAETSCDYTLQGPNGCGAKNNSHRFGGFPGMKIV